MPESTLTTADRSYLLRSAAEYAEQEWSATDEQRERFPAWYVAECEAEDDPTYWPKMNFDTWERFARGIATT